MLKRALAYILRKHSRGSAAVVDKFRPLQRAIISLAAIGSLLVLSPTCIHAQKQEGTRQGSFPHLAEESAAETANAKSNQSAAAPAVPESTSTKDGSTDKPETASAPVSATAATPPQQASPAGQFIFYAPDGVSLASSPVVAWDPVNQQMVFTPTPTIGAQDFLMVNPTTFQANCGSAASPSEIASDVDSTLYFIGHCGGDTSPGIERFFFRLDVSGSLALVGSNYGTLAGGIGTDLDGNTCISYVNQDGTFAANQGCGNIATMFDRNSGLAKQYAGLPSVGTANGPASNGFPYIVRSVDSTLTGSVTNYPLYTTAGSGYGGAGMYRLEVYIVASGSAPNATMQFTVSYNDGQAAQTLMSGAPVLFDTQGNFINFSQPFYVTGSTQILASTVTTNSPTYHVALRLIAE